MLFEDYIRESGKFQRREAEEGERVAFSCRAGFGRGNSGAKRLSGRDVIGGHIPRANALQCAACAGTFAARVKRLKDNGNP
jgi:hypothetical protein